MAEQSGNTRNNDLDVLLLKNKQISVLVEDAVPDILVVSYEHGVKIFRGVLLDSTKKNLPCGVNALNPAFNATTKTNADDDVLYSVSQRFAYTDPSKTKKKNVQVSSKYKNNKMTVRLRPRQVLCSKCKGICNENSENVSRKRKSIETTVQQVPPIKRGANAPITRSVYSELKKEERKATLVPKLSRLTQNEITNALSGNVNKLNIVDCGKKPLSPTTNDNVKNNNVTTDVENKNNTPKQQNPHSSVHSDTVATSTETATTKSLKRILRKKRSVGSMEDLWDETCFEENKNNPTAEQPSTNTTRTLKISFGQQGEETVLKIPAEIDPVNDDSEENINTDREKDTASYKAARRALKKAKKEARRKVLLAGGSPCYLGGGSPRYSFAGASPRYTVGSASPRNGLGGNSPRYVAAAAAYELNVPRRRKHKVKHKKKHKEEREKDKKHKEAEVSSTQDDTAKEPYVTQKLSINLKRLNNTYTTSSSSLSTTAPPTEETQSSSDEHSSELVPDFPPPQSPLVLRINAHQSINSALGADGGRLLVGDVVWGKIQGFPWWPGKVLTITNQLDNQGPQAQVAWYGSSTSSLMQCDQLCPYLENFKLRYNKKKRGPYKEAVRQATTEARENAENRLRESLVNASPARNIINNVVVPPALASPREIDVVS